jgi:hypothetical protein
MAAGKPRGIRAGRKLKNEEENKDGRTSHTKRPI